MTSDVVLSAALRTNLLSLQKTQSLIDQTQERLATGLKVNSSLDDAQSFFAAKALNNRATDLSRLLDGLSQSIRTVEAADAGITALTGLVEQADAIATAALDAVSGSSIQAKITGSVDLSDVTDLTDLSGIEDNDQITFTVNDSNGDAVTLSNGNSGSAGIVQIDTDDSIDQLIANINDLTNSATGEQALEASLNADGQLEIKSLLGGDLRIDFSTGDRDVAEALGLDSVTVDEIEDNPTANRYAVTISGSATLTSNVFYKATGSAAGLADASTTLITADNASGTNYFTGQATDLVVLSVDGGSLQTVGDISTLTFQGFVDSINSNTSLNTKIQASFDDTTGQLSIVSIDASVKTIQIGAQDVATDGVSADFGFGLAGATAPSDATNDDYATESIAFGAAASELATLQSDYNNIRTQIDALVEDAGYRGVNLLNGDDLVSYFNEDRTNSLTTSGTDFTAAGLGLSVAAFRDSSTINSVRTEVDAALTNIRNFGNTVANNLAIIQNRQDFTSELINTLQAGADDLTLADTNEEGANLLALQTRQALGTTALSLASQSQQSVLRLF